MEGTLWKWTNFFSGWQPRWFVLEDGILSYYLSQDQVINGCKGSVKLSVCDVNVHSTDPTRLDLIIPNEAHFYLRAPTQQERQRWLIALGSCKACLEDGQPARAREELASEELRTRKSELRLYADLIRQQASALKDEFKEDVPPDMQKVNEATSLLHAACDTLLRTLDDCMRIAEPRPRNASSVTLRPGSPPVGSGPVSPGPVTANTSNPSSARSVSGSTSLLHLVNGADLSASPSTSISNSLPQTPPLTSTQGEDLWHPSVTQIDSVAVEGPPGETSGGLVSGDASLQLPPIRSRTPRHRQEVQTFFSAMPASFEDIRLYREKEDIPSVPFIEACKSIMEIFSYLNNTALAPVKMDVAGNIRKLQQKYSTAPTVFHSVQIMLRQEIEMNQHRDHNSATVATLWLKRSIEFVRELLVEVLNDNSECLEILASNAYNRSLRQYHGWVVRGVFALASKALPTRSAFLRQLAPTCTDFDHPLFAESLRKDMGYYVESLTRIASVLNQFYESHGLDQLEKI